MLDIILFRNDLAAWPRGSPSAALTLDTAAFEALERERKDIQTRTQDAAGQAQHAVEADRRREGQGRGCGALLAEVAGLGDTLKALEAELASVQAQAARLPARCCPNLTHASTPAGQARPTTTSRCGAGARRATFDFAAEGPHRPRRGAGPARFRDRREALRRALLVPARRPRAAASRARAVHARHAHARAWLHRVLHALHRQRARRWSARRSCPSSKPTCSR